MDKIIIKDNIKEVSVKLFSEKGFHGTSIREIAREAQCSLPMLYYYYKSKEELFYEVAYREFIALSERLYADAKSGRTIQETYFEAIKQRKELGSYDKAVYKLSMKVWLGFHGDQEVRKALLDWEKDWNVRAREIITHYGKTKELELLNDILFRITENMIEKIILFDEDIPDEEIKKILECVIK